MAPDPTDPREQGGVLNPAVARGPDGQLYLLPRLVASDNVSRIGLARVVCDRRGTPVGVERLGVVLEPAAPYELTPAGGGVEDPRVTYVAAARHYVMTYTALGPAGPRIAFAVSRDLLHWQRRGLVRFTTENGLAPGTVDNKDAVLFPEPLRAPDGQLALALIHRPDFRTGPATGQMPFRRDPPSMWLSYAPLGSGGIPKEAVPFGQHTLLLHPEQRWERLKVGAGTPPLRTPAGWLVLYHGVAGRAWSSREQVRRYSAGILLLEAQDPRRILYRSPESVLEPRVAAERVGVVAQVVFPTGVELGADGRLDVYYGMADSRIGVARAGLAALLAPLAARVA
jgi:predicted GH43/DUF377 family glycosyl hydrolase